MNKPTRKITSADKLVVHYTTNVREANRYKLDIMAEQIVSVGRIIEPIVVEETEEGFLVLKGNRRTRAVEMMLADHQVVTNILLAMADSETDTTKAAEMRSTVVKRTAEVVENLQKVEIVVYKGLTLDEREEIIMDHGTVLTLCRTETVKCVWRKAKMGKSESEIIRSMYAALADYTGNKKKLAEVEAIKEPKAKEKALTTWLHGTVGNQMLAALMMGPYVQEQFVLSRRSEDRLLEEGEKVEMFCSTTRMVELSAAKSADKKTEKGWSPEEGGEAFNAKIAQFKAEDSGAEAPEKKKRPSVSDLEKKSDMFKVGAIRKAFLLAAGQTGDKVGGLVDDDDRIARQEAVMTKLSRGFEKLPDTFKEFARKILDGTPSEVEEYLAALSK